jgi:predicted small lipoprotein YifL
LCVNLPWVKRAHAQGGQSGLFLKQSKKIMSIHTVKKIILLCLLLTSFSTLYGCGQTGPLYLPTAGDQSNQQQPVAKD